MLRRDILASLLVGGVIAELPFHGDQLIFDWNHSLYAPYVNGDGVNGLWEFNALVSKYEHVQLTPDLPKKVGWVFNKGEFEADDWSVEFYFRIQAEKTPGDGFAFWFTEHQFEEGEAYGAAETFKGLAIVFDTYRNAREGHEFPWISAMIGNGSDRFDHNQDGANLQIGGCHAKIVNTGDPVRALITFYGGRLRVDLTIHNKESRCIDAVAPTGIPKSGYLGFSGRTGGFSSQHNLLSVTVAKIAPLTPSEPPIVSAALDSSIAEDRIHTNTVSLSNETVPHDDMLTAVLLLGIVCLMLGYVAYSYRKRTLRIYR